MEKSIDEMREEVIAYCSQVCPDVNEVSFQSMFNLVNRPLEQGAMQYTDRVWEFIHPNFTFLIYAESPFIPMAYRLLGLESRDKDAEIARLMDLLVECRSGITAMAAAMNSKQESCQGTYNAMAAAMPSYDLIERIDQALKGGNDA